MKVFLVLIIITMGLGCIYGAIVGYPVYEDKSKLFWDIAIPYILGTVGACFVYADYYSEQ